MNIGEKIKNERTYNGISQFELANMVGLDKSVMNRIELGTRPIRDDELLKFSKALNVSVDYLLGTDFKPKPKSFKIPVYSAVAAGCPLFTNDEIVDYEEVPIEWENQGEFFAVRLKGDSMLPRFASGDVIIVKKQNDVDNGELALVLINGDEATFKRVEKNSVGILLVAFNNAVFPPKLYTFEDIERLPVQILGKVIEARLKF